MKLDIAHTPKVLKINKFAASKAISGHLLTHVLLLTSDFQQTAKLIMGQENSVRSKNNVTRVLQLFRNKRSSLRSHTKAKIHILPKNSHIENPNFYKIHLTEISFFTKFTFLKSQFPQNSHL